MIPLEIIYGPTACGKTALSVERALHSGAHIISADARQIYRELDIGTGKILPHEMQNIPHYGLSIVDVGTVFTVQEFRSYADDMIRSLHEKGIPIIICGWTGLYLDALAFQHDIPAVPPDWDLRREMTALAEKRGPEVVWNILRAEDSEYAKELHPNNLTYVVRGLEVIRTLWTSKGQYKNARTPRYDIHWMTPYSGDRKALWERIEKRVSAMLSDGMIEETERMLERGFDATTPGMDAIGYPEVMSYLRGECDLESCKNLITVHTRQYAKRQETWNRRYRDISQV